MLYVQTDVVKFQCFMNIPDVETGNGLKLGKENLKLLFLLHLN